jgi:hypothetical protein
LAKRRYRSSYIRSQKTKRRIITSLAKRRYRSSYNRSQKAKSRIITSLAKRRWNMMMSKWRSRRWKWSRAMVIPTNPLMKVMKKISLYHCIYLRPPPP